MGVSNWYIKIPLIMHKDEQFVYSNEIYVLKNILKLIECIKNNNYSNFNYSFLSVARSYICDYNDNDISKIISSVKFENHYIAQLLINEKPDISSERFKNILSKS